MMSHIETILRVCGIGNYLQMGNGKNSLVFQFLKRAIDAYGMDTNDDIVQQNLQRAPGRFFKGSLLNYPFQEERFDTIILGDELLSLDKDNMMTALSALTRMTRRNLVLYFSHETLQSFPENTLAQQRIFWEHMALQAGFRLHPRRMLINPYASLEDERTGVFTFFERIPKDAVLKFPMAWISDNKDMRMDMLRETGRRSDARIARYMHAATYIRPGDKVVDAGCGLGFGTAILSATSTGAKFIGVDLDACSIEYANANYTAMDSAIEFHEGDICNLYFLGDHSIDTVIAFDTIESLIDYDAFLREVRRVLKPDGRFIGSVPNLWCDESGRDPDPYHFHVFDWHKIQETLANYFIVDSRWAQNAGGGFKLPNQPRQMGQVPLSYQQPFDTEWWVFTAFNDPLKSGKHPYTNPFQREQDVEVPALVRFEQFYDNPWVYRVMVQLGERIIDQNTLSHFCLRVLEHARLGSADQGAALCVLGYQLLDSDTLTIADLAPLIEQINMFDQSYDHKNLHAYRWAVSLHFIGGRLLLAVGNREQALQAFLDCAAMDPMHFSPLLATKTISARMYAGLIYSSYKKTTEARQQFILGVKESHRVLQGDWANVLGNIDKPLSFGLQEAAEVLDVASQCAQALHALDREQSVPGYFWDRINMKRFGLVEWNKNIERENKQLHQRIRELSVR